MTDDKEKYIYGVHLIGVAQMLRDPGVKNEVFLDEKYDTEEEARKRMLSLKGAIDVRTNYGYMRINFNNIVGSRVVRLRIETDATPKVKSNLMLPNGRILN